MNATFLTRKRLSVYLGLILLLYSSFNTSHQCFALSPLKLRSVSSFQSFTLTSSKAQHSDRGNFADLNQRNKKIALMASAPVRHDLAVRFDQPVLSPSQFNAASGYMWKSILAVLLSDVFKTAILAFFIALAISVFSKGTGIKSASSIFQPLVRSVTLGYKYAQGQINKLRERFIRNEPEGEPLEFEDAGDGDEWGVCTLASKKPIGRSQYIQYDFKLPRPDNTLQLALGQQVTLCCLDEDENVAKKNYFLYSPKNTMGSFSILASAQPGKEKKLRPGEGDFSKVLRNGLEIGDEVALQPGPSTLNYKGQYLPVTDMVYFASGDGIVPVIDQVRSVLPQGSSSVKGVSVIWTNEDEEDFDIALSDLEDEYFKYTTKLAVSCIISDPDEPLDRNDEIDDAVPSFKPGTMAVVSGSKSFVSSAKAILMNKDYPENCICDLPSS